MNPPLWVTYAWADNADGDFDFLTATLRNAGIECRYDKIALIPGRRLWDQIAEEITKGDLAGWAYLVTPQSLASQACQEELAYALQRALGTKGDAFPLIGLLFGVRFADLPPALAVRLCVDLRSPDWVEQVRAGVERRPPAAHAPAGAAPFKTRVHANYCGQPNHLAVEFTPRFGELRYWRIGFLATGPQPVARGVGPANGGGIGPVFESYVEGHFDFQGDHMNFFGAGNALSPATSAYVVFDGPLPQRMAFGWATEPLGTPPVWWPLRSG